MVGARLFKCLLLVLFTDKSVYWRQTGYVVREVGYGNDSRLRAMWYWLTVAVPDAVRILAAVVRGDMVRN